MGEMIACLHAPGSDSVEREKLIAQRRGTVRSVCLNYVKRNGFHTQTTYGQIQTSKPDSDQKKSNGPKQEGVCPK